MAGCGETDMLPVPDACVAPPMSRASCPTYRTSNLCASCIVDMPELEEHVRCKAHSWHHDEEHLPHGTSFVAASLQSVPLRSSPPPPTQERAKDHTSHGKQPCDSIHLPLVKQLQRLAFDTSTAGHQIDCLASMTSPEILAGHAASVPYKSGPYAPASPASEALNIARSEIDVSLAVKRQTAVHGGHSMRTLQCEGQCPSQDTKVSKWKPALVRPQTRCGRTWLSCQMRVARMLAHIFLFPLQHSRLPLLPQLC